MNKVALIVQILQAKKNLLCDDLDECRWNTGLLVTFNEAQEVFAERFEDNTNVGRFWSNMSERVQERDNVVTARMKRRCSRNLR
jgi:hypothetical protein